MAGKLSDDHWRGGKEYYAKMMLRNRLPSYFFPFPFIFHGVYLFFTGFSVR